MEDWAPDHPKGAPFKRSEKAEGPLALVRRIGQRATGKLALFQWLGKNGQFSGWNVWKQMWKCMRCADFSRHQLTRRKFHRDKMALCSSAGAKGAQRL